MPRETKIKDEVHEFIYQIKILLGLKNLCLTFIFNFVQILLEEKKKG